MYYFAKAYIKPENRKRYKDITVDEKGESFLGFVIIQDRFDKAIEIITRLRFDVAISKSLINIDQKRIDMFGRDIYIDDINTDREVTPSDLADYLSVSGREYFWLHNEIVGLEKHKKLIKN